MMPLTLAAGLGLVAALASTTLAAAGGDPLSRYVDRSRVLVVVAPDGSDRRVVEQRKLFAAMKAGARERDLVLVEGFGHTPQAQALRERFGIEPSAFRAVLIGKDGGDKLASETPLGADRLFPLIDAMPMRREEMRR